VRFSTDGVDVLGAVPAAGFATDVEAEDDGSTRVDFESEQHRSRLKVGGGTVRGTRSRSRHWTAAATPAM
jgi:hypothetical protein